MPHAFDPSSATPEAASVSVTPHDPSVPEPPPRPEYDTDLEERDGIIYEVTRLRKLGDFVSERKLEGNDARVAAGHLRDKHLATLGWAKIHDGLYVALPEGGTTLGLGAVLDLMPWDTAAADAEHLEAYLRVPRGRRRDDDPAASLNLSVVLLACMRNRGYAVGVRAATTEEAAVACVAYLHRYAGLAPHGAVEHVAAKLSLPPAELMGSGGPLLNDWFRRFVVG